MVEGELYKIFRFNLFIAYHSTMLLGFDDAFSIYTMHTCLESIKVAHIRLKNLNYVTGCNDMYYFLMQSGIGSFTY